MDLSTEYLGLELDSPLVISACQPLSESPGHVEDLEEAGASAVVLHSLFEEQIMEDSLVLDHYLSYGEESFAEAMDYFPEMDEYNVGPEKYLELISEAKSRVDIPVIGSLNGVSRGGWINHAERIEQAGADALELNIYYIPTDTGMSGGEVEQMYVDVLESVKETISIPLAMKLSPFFSSIPSMASKLVEGGAEALVLFNRFYQPDFNIEALEVEPDLQLSRSYDMRLPLRWASILHGKIDADIAITSGVHTYRDVLKAMMGGASITMMASEILQNGIGRLGEMKIRLREWMEEHEYRSIKQMQGSMCQDNLPQPAAIERANYTKTIHSWKPDPTGRTRLPGSS
ncbi:MAG: dihydroorotate dehydrogenase-like protein [bacterium]